MYVRSSVGSNLVGAYPSSEAAAPPARHTIQIQENRKHHDSQAEILFHNADVHSLYGDFGRMELFITFIRTVRAWCMCALCALCAGRILDDKLMAMT